MQQCAMRYSSKCCRQEMTICKDEVGVSVRKRGFGYAIDCSMLIHVAPRELELCD